MNLQQTLRDKGFAVTVVTRRGLNFDQKKLYTMQTIREMGLQSMIENNRGEVEVRITTPDKQHSKAVSICHKNDRFNKENGMIVAFHRALSGLGLDDYMIPVYEEQEEKRAARIQKAQEKAQKAQELKTKFAKV